MAIIKFRDNDNTWKALDRELIMAIKNRLRCDKNLSDVIDRSKARENLGLIGDVTTHHHDGRYLSKIEDCKNIFRDSVAEQKRDVDAFKESVRSEQSNLKKYIDNGMERLKEAKEGLEKLKSDINNIVADRFSQIEQRINNALNSQKTADNANKLQGKDLNALYRHLGGREIPTLVPLVDWEHMNQERSGGHSIRNLSNSGTGIVAYGGDSDFRNGYPKGTIFLKQSYKNFDKILVCGADDNCDLSLTTLWDTWQLEFMFNNSYQFALFESRGNFWNIWGNKRGSSNAPLSTETVWRGNGQNSGIVEIYGVNY